MSHVSTRLVNRKLLTVIALSLAVTAAIMVAAWSGILRPPNNPSQPPQSNAHQDQSPKSDSPSAALENQWETVDEQIQQLLQDSGAWEPQAKQLWDSQPRSVQD